MKNIKYIITVILCLTTILSCEKDFLDRAPLGSLTEGTFPSSEADAIAAVNGVYHMLRIWQINGGFPFLDIAADDISKGSRPGDTQVLDLFDSYDAGIPTNDGLILGWWSSLYEAVRRANFVINEVPNIAMDEDLKSRIIGEARYLRAYYYSNLVRIWGDVPLKLTTEVSATALPRTAAATIWDDVIFPDLEYAIANLPEKSGYDSVDMGRATKGAARSLHAKLSLFVGDFANAEKYALEVINSGEYDLEPVFGNIWTPESEFGIESIFEVGALNSAAFGDLRNGEPGYQLATTVGSPGRGWGFGRPTYNFIQDWSNDDPRKEASILYPGEVKDGYVVGNEANTPDITYDASGTTIIEIETYMEKYWVADIDDNAVWAYNRRIIRYADVLLMAAEALNENGKSAQALPYLEMVRARARGGNNAVLPEITTTDQTELRNAIYDERKYELAHEGIRFWDLVRTGRTATVLGPLGFVQGVHEVFPIPDAEIEVSGGVITQNNGY
ncbi:RagB/SusD family nutrient uptake outer membrane protein [Seonamhaeicola sp.]|uniref:RagB/SusD family nutrient uptake outer membrane protein n=1 Tax=Seonamhaeicola sp. TaxID=1912245 RepID=UPI0026203301|nr:RagB/SusD family nutrient uptake outer membrane protein [Seonamhaeicola sp.]